MKILLSIVIITLLSLFAEARWFGRKAAIETINEFRNSKGRGSLIERSELTKFAQDWANHLSKGNCKLISSPRSHRPYKTVGENLYAGIPAWGFISNWKKSKRQRAKMLRSDITAIGLGHTKCTKCSSFGK